MEIKKDFKAEIQDVRNKLLEMFTNLENQEITAKEANSIRRESNKKLKAILKDLKQVENGEAGNDEQTF